MSTKERMPLATVQTGEPTEYTEYSSGADQFGGSHLRGIRVSMFENVYGIEPKEVELVAILNAIRSGKYKDRIRRARELFAAWKQVCPALDNKESPEAKIYD